MKLKVDTIAPDFKIIDYSGKIQSIKQYRGKKLLVSFFRYASCPLCNLQVQKLIKEYEPWKKMNLEILAIFESPSNSISEYVGMQKSSFPIIPDPELRLYKLYKLESNWLKFIPAAIIFIIALLKGFRMGRTEGDRAIVPADFLLDENGIIQTAYYGKHIGDHLSMKRIKQFIIQDKTKGKHNEKH